MNSALTRTIDRASNATNPDKRRRWEISSNGITFSKGDEWSYCDLERNYPREVKDQGNIQENRTIQWKDVLEGQWDSGIY